MLCTCPGRPTLSFFFEWPLEPTGSGDGQNWSPRCVVIRPHASLLSTAQTSLCDSLCPRVSDRFWSEHGLDCAHPRIGQGGYLRYHTMEPWRSLEEGFTCPILGCVGVVGVCPNHAVSFCDTQRGLAEDMCALDVTGVREYRGSCLCRRWMPHACAFRFL